jgi:ABC-type nitrate/sulfonate/bicarbonate transport system permease component
MDERIAFAPISIGTYVADSIEPSRLPMTIAVFWQVLASLAFPGSTIFLGPLALVARMSRSTAMLSPILGPLSETLRSSALGLCLAIVLGAIWGLASPLSRTKIWFDFILMPFQALPIIAGVQVIGLAFGRGYVATVVIVILATIYPIYRGVSDHLAQAPSNLARYSTLYDIPRVRQLWFIYRNWVILGMLRGVRSAAPRAILGATVAETFLSGGGLGWLVYHARGTLDFTQVWLILTAVLLISLLTDVLMSFVEMIVSAKFRM